MDSYYNEISKKKKPNILGTSTKDLGYLKRQIQLEDELEAYEKRLGIYNVSETHPLWMKGF
jgi:hypothetical protein